MGVLAFPSLVMGSAAMSIMAEITFMPGFHAISKSSQRASTSGEGWRLMRSCTLLSAMALVFPRARLDVLRVNGFVFKAGFVGVGGKIRFGGFHELGIVAFREIWFVVRAAGFIAQCRTLGDHAGELQHVVKLASEDERSIRPHTLVTKVDALESMN